jgi:hypothetical protein
MFDSWFSLSMVLMLLPAGGNKGDTQDMLDELVRWTVMLAQHDRTRPAPAQY